MPYISQGQREDVDLFRIIPSNAGELNYKITTLLVGYMSKHGKRYQTMNDIMGALEGAKLELYRRIAAPYEDKKIKENGDVY